MNCDQRLWMALWLGTLLLLSPGLLIQLDLLLIGQIALALIASLLLTTNSLSLRLGLSAVLLLALPFAVVQRHASADLWSDPQHPLTLYELVSRQSLLNRGASPERIGHPWTAVKTWVLPEAGSFNLTFDVRRVSGEPGWEWYAYNPLFSFEKMSVEDTPFLRVYPPDVEADFRFITREINTGAPLANRTFRARIDLRSPEPLMGRGCQGLRIQVVAGQNGGRCRDVQLTNDWQSHELVWTAPPDVRSPVVRLSLYNIDVASYDLRGGSLEELRDGVWRPFTQLEPEGLLVRAVVPSTHRALVPRLTVVPRDEWQHVSLLVDTHQLTRQQTLSFLAQLEGGMEVAIRNLRLEGLDSVRQPRPLPVTRQNLWFSHANLAGHSLATTGLVLIGLKLGGWQKLSGVSAAFVTVLLTGSRAAWLALMVGSALLSLPLFVKGWRFWFWALVGFTLLALASGTLIGRLNVFNSEDISDVSRLAIWRAAWQSFLSHPWTGVGTDFATYWQQTYSGENTEIITHAHNLWLQFAAVYGVPGLLAVLWLTGGFLYLAWHWGRGRGLALVVPILVMNLFDYTFFYSGVLFPLILGVNVLRSDSERKVAAGEASASTDKAAPINT